MGGDRLKQDVHKVVNKYKFTVIDTEVLHALYNELVSTFKEHGTTMKEQNFSLKFNNNLYLIDSEGIQKYNTVSGKYKKYV